MLKLNKNLEEQLNKIRHLNTDVSHESPEEALNFLLQVGDDFVDILNHKLEYCHEAELEYRNAALKNDRKFEYLEWMLALWNSRYFQWEQYWFTKPILNTLMHQRRPNWPYLSGENFEELVSAMLFLIEEKEYNTTVRTGDDGIDLECIEQWQTSIGDVTVRTAVQCKLWHEQIGSPIIREFVGARGLYTMGYFVTSGRITQPAQQWARQQAGFHYYDGLYLVDTLILNQLLKKANSIYESFSELLRDDLEDGEGKVISASILTLQTQAKSLLDQARITPVPEETLQPQLSLSWDE